MGSRNYIGYSTEDGNVTFSYCHRGAQMKYNGKALITHFNTEKEARALAFHGEMSSIDHEDGSIYGYKNPDTTATVSLNAYLTMSERGIESLFLWRNSRWYVKSDYHLRDNEWHGLCDLLNLVKTPQQLSERQKDLQSRMSKLCELSAELEHYYEKLKDDDSDLGSLEQEYQDLFSETVLEFGN